MLCFILHARLRVPSSIRHSLRPLSLKAREIFGKARARGVARSRSHAATYAVIARLDRAIQ
jgi:hypothetical protein